MSVGYYLSFSVTGAIDPQAAQLTAVLREIWLGGYPKLSESGDASVEAAINRVFRLFGEPEEPAAHRRVVQMAHTMVLSALPTLEIRLPEDPRPMTSVLLVEEWLRNPVAFETIAGTVRRHMSTLLGIRAPDRATDDALRVTAGVLRCLDPTSARSAALSLLHGCFVDYAVFPGASRPPGVRRDYFNWWVLEVVPHSYVFKTPQRIYSVRWPWPPPNSQGNLL